MARDRALGPIVLLLIVVGMSAAFFFWVLQSPDQVRVFLIRLVLISLVIFLGILLIRFFTLLWFGFLQHAERDIQGDRTDVQLPPVSVIVPAYNEGTVLERAIQSLLRLDYPEYEVLIIDDGSPDDTLATAAALEGVYDGVPIRVFTKPNGGKATALNLGIANSRHPFILCMDADSTVEPQLLRRALPHFEDPTVGAVAGNVKIENRDRLITRLQALEYIEGLNMVRQAQAFFRTVNIIPGPIGVFRRSALLKIGGYETDTFAEDCDLTLRLLVEGWQIQYEPESIAYTEAPENLLDLLKQRYRWTRGILQALNKHRRLLVSPRRGFSIWFTLWYMIFEGVAWPIMNVFAHVLFVCIAANYGASLPLVIWYAQLTVLDLAAAIYCVLLEEERISLIPYALLYRAFFALTIDVAKVFASIEEVLRFRMDWGKLERIGRI